MTGGIELDKGVSTTFSGRRTGGLIERVFSEEREGSGVSDLTRTSHTESHPAHHELSPTNKNLEKNSRQIVWNFEILSRLLKQIIACRKAVACSESAADYGVNQIFDQGLLHPFDQVKEIIEMP